VHPNRLFRAPESKLNHAHTARDSATGKRIRVPRLEKIPRAKESPPSRRVDHARYPRVNNLRK
jgi:hypothetical protein